jgi:hypothetical protein
LGIFQYLSRSQNITCEIEKENPQHYDRNFEGDDIDDIFDAEINSWYDISLG